MPSFSIKSQRRLEKLGVPAAFMRGESLVLVGPTYEHRREPGTLIRLAFAHDEEQRICVGYARHTDHGWEIVEVEPFSQRALGYYQRRLKRVGERVTKTN